MRSIASFVLPFIAAAGISGLMFTAALVDGLAPLAPGSFPMRNGRYAITRVTALSLVFQRLTCSKAPGRVRRGSRGPHRAI